MNNSQLEVEFIPGPIETKDLTSDQITIDINASLSFRGGVSLIFASDSRVGSLNRIEARRTIRK